MRPEALGASTVGGGRGQTLRGAGEGSVTSLGKFSRDTCVPQSSAYWLAGGVWGFASFPFITGHLPLQRSPHKEEYSKPSPPTCPILSLTRPYQTQAPGLGHVRGDGKSTGLNSGPSSSQTCCVILSGRSPSLGLVSSYLQCWSLSRFCRGPCAGWKRISRHQAE